MDTESLLSGLTAAQRHAVETEATPLCILAGAGAGKTRVLTRRIGYRIATNRADAGHVLALTFTRKAAGELGDRLRTLGVREPLTAGTFHAVAYAQLRQYWADRGEPAPQLLDRKTKLLGRLVAGRPHLAGASLGDLAAEIEWASARCVRPEEYATAVAAASRRPPVPAEAVAALYARYESEKQQRRLADFDDLLSRCAQALEHDPAFAAVQRWRWRHLFVDEFQDVNPLQHRLLSAWLGDRHDLCVVGDPNQAVYGWNGGDPSLLAELPERWPGTEVVHLDDNHRCSPQVVSAAAGVLGPLGQGLRSSRPDGPWPTVRSYPTDTAEAHGVITEVRQARDRGLAWSQLAILVRTNAQAVAFEAACRAARVPYRLAGARALLDDADIQRELSALAGPGRRSEPLAMITSDWSARIDPSEQSPGSAALTVLVGLAGDFRRMDPHPTVDGFLSWLRPATSHDRIDQPGDLLTISTFHRSKGLEWQAVWVTGLELGLVPIGPDEGYDEERRLLYVALTRAAHELHCTWAEQRAFGSRLVPRTPSPWLAAIVAAGAGPAAVDPRPWRESLADQRARLAACRPPGGSRPGGGSSGGGSSGGGSSGGGSEADLRIVAALTAWRAGAARGAAVPAHVLLHDATIGAIATMRPATTDELLAVPGLGPLKVARYGTVILDLLAGRQASA